MNIHSFCEQTNRMKGNTKTKLRPGSWSSKVSSQYFACKMTVKRESFKLLRGRQERHRFAYLTVKNSSFACFVTLISKLLIPI